MKAVILDEMIAMIHRTTYRRRRLPNRSRAFTLIEVLVTLALTMIMMVLFASIFKGAADFVTRQKGIGENDQSARILTTVLQTDLQARTMRFLAPFHPNMSALTDDQNRQGYFYYSENNPMDDTDDVLQFTIAINAPNFLSTTTNPMRGKQLSGLATNLPLPWQANTQYAAGAYVRPAGTTTNLLPTGFIYKNLGGTFTSGANEPNWDNPTGPPASPPFALGQTVSDGPGTWTTVLSAIDQPDGDDAVMSYLSPSGAETINPPNVSPNNTGASQAAEVAYFLRHGSLIRRVLLIRNPYNYGINPPGTSSSQPYAQDTAGTYLIPGAYPPTGYANTFWGDFDYSARIQVGGSPGVQFLATSSPESSLANINPGSLPIGRPDNRFGFDQVYNIPPGTPAGTQTFNGVPREYALQYNSQTNAITNGGNPVFFGRYTLEETSNSAFLFPGSLPKVGPAPGTPTSPMGSSSILGLDSASYTMWLLNANPPNPAQSLSFAGGARRGEDILLTNVVSFDVKLWDNNYSEVTAGYDVNRNGIIDSGPAFADVGHGASGDFQQSKNAFPVYGPNILNGYTVPALGSNSWSPPDTNPANTYISGGVTNNYNYNNVFDTWSRAFNFDNLPRTYDNVAADGGPGPAATTGILYAPAPYRPRLGNPWAANTPYLLNQQVDPVNTANGYVYTCVTPGTSQLAASLPANQLDPFSLSDVPVPPGTAGAPPVGAYIQDGTVQWKAQPPANVQAIQITVKYLDPTHNLLRQVTIVQSLTQ